MSKMLPWSLSLMVGALLAAGPAVRAQEEPELLTIDQEYARLAGEVPGFGGLYLDAAGTTHVYLQDLSLAREVRDLGERVEAHQGEYDFRDLFAWKDAVRDLLAQPGAVFLDIDEQRNRLLFGVEEDSVAAFTAELQVFLRGTRVPPGAVLVEAAEPIEFAEKLTDRIRPIPGGVMINGNCTLGVNAWRAATGKGFITASHCSEVMFGLDDMLFAQNTPFLVNMVGTEVVDPAALPGGSCPPGRLCRRSDATFVDYLGDGGMSAGGRIAHPDLCAPVAGSITVNPDFPRLPLKSVSFSTPAVGTFMTKVGITTGCTTGPMHQTCVDANVGGTNFTLLCQNRVLAGVAGGDSGAPVFRDHGDKATLYGILWGKNGTLFTYSPWNQVFFDLGAPTPDLLP